MQQSPSRSPQVSRRIGPWVGQDEEDASEFVSRQHPSSSTGRVKVHAAYEADYPIGTGSFPAVVKTGRYP